MNIGIFGGTFDPPHIGHLVIADQALTQLKLDEVWFMPVGQPPHKVGNHISEPRHRLAMVKLAIANHAGFKLSRVDADRPAPHYSVTALEILEAKHPQHDWCFVMGADSLSDLPHWHMPHRLIELATLAVAGRPGARPDTTELQHEIPGLCTRVRWVDAPLVDLSSTQLRMMTREQKSLKYLVPDTVAHYVQEHKLYI